MNSPPFSAKGYPTPKNPEPTTQCVELDRSVKKERTSYIPTECRPGEEKVGFICYKSCPEKWTAHPEFPDSCRRCRDFSETCDFLDMIVQKRTRTGTAVYCKPGDEKVGGLCYSPCPPGYQAESNMCIKCK
jgi:hypothetical protein